MNQLNQIEDPDINVHTYKNLVLDQKSAKITQWKKKVSLSNGAGIAFDIQKNENRSTSISMQKN